MPGTRLAPGVVGGMLSAAVLGVLLIPVCFVALRRLMGDKLDEPGRAENPSGDRRQAIPRCHWTSNRSLTAQGSAPCIGVSWSCARWSPCSMASISRRWPSATPQPRRRVACSPRRAALDHDRSAHRHRWIGSHNQSPRRLSGAARRTTRLLSRWWAFATMLAATSHSPKRTLHVALPHRHRPGRQLAQRTRARRRRIRPSEPPKRCWWP